MPSLSCPLLTATCACPRPPVLPDNLYLDMVSLLAPELPCFMLLLWHVASTLLAPSAHAPQPLLAMVSMRPPPRRADCRPLPSPAPPCLAQNGIIHNCTHGNNPDVKLTEDEMIVKIFTYLDKLFHIVKPQASSEAQQGSGPVCLVKHRRASKPKAAAAAQTLRAAEAGGPRQPACQALPSVIERAPLSASELRPIPTHVHALPHPCRSSCSWRSTAPPLAPR